MTDRDKVLEAVKGFRWWNYGLDNVSEAQSDDWAHALADEIVVALDGKTGGPWTSHGHPIEGVTVVGNSRPPLIARCGGPALCSTCRADAERIRREAGRG